MSKRIMLLIFFVLLFFGIIVTFFLLASESTKKKLFPISINGKYGFIDQNGQLVIKPIFDTAEKFSDGLALIQKDSQRGFIDTSGKMVIVLNAEKVRSFSNNRAAILINNNWGFIDKKGDIIISSKYKTVQDFSDGLAVVKNERNESLYIDINGDEKFHGLFFKTAGDLTNGYMIVSQQLYDNIFETVEINGVKRNYFVSGIRKGVLSLQGELVVPIEYSLFDTVVSDNAIAYGEEVIIGGKKSAKWGYLSMANTSIISPKFAHAGRFFKGVAPVSSDGSKYGLINKKGEYILFEKYDVIQSFSSDLAVYNHDKKYGFLNLNGEVAISAQFDFANPFDGELAYVKKNGIEGYVTKNGTIYLNTQY